MTEQRELSARQFGDHAANYLTSPVHAGGADLVRLTELVRTQAVQRVLDLGCGAGHAALAAARGGAAHVTACDPSPAMLAVVAREAAARGANRLETRLASAEELPFADASFELVVTRYSAHHWADVPRALRECARVGVSGARLVVIDVVSPEVPLLDTSLQVVEFLRDASHVRNYRITEWSAMLRAAGFGAPVVDTWKLPLDFASWIARIGTPPERVAALRSVFAALPGEVRNYFGVAADGSFVIDSAWFEAGAAQ